MKKELTPDMKHWARNIQKENFPSWIEAFAYAYDLGFERGKEQISGFTGSPSFKLMEAKKKRDKSE